MNFKEYLNYYKSPASCFLFESAALNKHLDHLDELLLIDKDSGLKRTIEIIRDLKEILAGNSKSKVYTTVKLDGAPAIIFGHDKDTGRFFVSTKSLGNVTPKINYTDADIDKNHGHAPGLVSKLKQALKYLPQIMKTKDIYQGDMMFSHEDLIIFEMDGERLIGFRPNTITYGFPTTSEEARKINNAMIGIAIHTRYEGTPRNLTGINFNVEKTEFKEAVDVWVQMAKFSDYSGTATFTVDEENKIDFNLQLIEKHKVNWDKLNDELFDTIKVFSNTLIRQGRFYSSSEKDLAAYKTYIEGVFQKQIDGVKTPAAKERKQNARDAFLSNVEANEDSITSMFTIMSLVAEIKSIIISKYNAMIKSKQFIEDENGNLKTTAPEGFVAVDRKGNAIKLVNRLEFSNANFAKTKSEKFK